MLRTAWATSPGWWRPISPDMVLSTTHEFFFAFAIACGVLLFGAWGFWFVIGKTRRVHWSFELPAAKPVDRL